MYFCNTIILCYCIFSLNIRVDSLIINLKGKIQLLTSNKYYIFYINIYIIKLIYLFKILKKNAIFTNIFDYIFDYFWCINTYYKTF